MTITAPRIGAALDRVEAPLKVTGAALYPNDVSYPGLAHAAPVRATIAAGRVTAIDTAEARAAEGVIAVVTALDAPRLRRGPVTLLGISPPAPLQDDRILHYGQYVAVVVADTAEQARHAASLVAVEYAEDVPMLDIGDPRAEVEDDPWGMDVDRGDLEAGLAEADVVIDETYATPDNTNNPLGLMSTVAVWHGDGSLTVHDATQWPHGVRMSLAETFGVPESRIRVLAPYVGGGFGAGLRAWQHVILAVLAARETGRPVKLVLTRPEMFTGVGYRPESIQRIRIGATRDGRLTALAHEAIAPVALEDDNFEAVSHTSARAYACPNVMTRDRQVRLNIPCPGSMRAPTEAQGNFALESAMDELAVDLGIDPLDLRLRNFAGTDPLTGLPWSSNALRECFARGAELFGWSRRTPEPGSMRDGHWRVGYGLAGASYPPYQVPCQARASLQHDGSAFVRSAATDIGTGTYTVMTQLAAELLGLDVARVRFDLGDTDMPYSPQAGGSGLTGALGNAVRSACRQLLQAFLDVVADDPESPLRGLTLDEVEAGGGGIHRAGDPGSGEAYTAILARHDLAELSADGRSTPPTPDTTAWAGAFGARFVEVRVDADLGVIRVARVVSVIDGGRVLNAKTATSQIVGGTVGGIGQALFEETVTDEGTGRIANATFGDYLIPVNADVPDMEVVFVGGPDTATPLGTKGVGEIGLVGIAAAVANAVHHATGRRLRSLPLTLDALL
ncbi:xanthine dehydrogenase family protein molybdopterin-binding subunit [Actinocorallia sp. API 0066]|uniref:xanthine dehydrogenase family protein molybdopterin-binding subunit n=1 Tax=Actinocorallia sp. API 0066 TaxID=2896846 RepID=UPI001E36C3E8|nr:xanthine dehydrogenase family protein molybdopterin-binding subunit [Actinocorallia sp. API 0066]MCD0451137.1 xanthine dehydrogenase family protein molybdopterin-binding subunit [Actinocorallia sp. API 0066]